MVKTKATSLERLSARLDHVVRTKGGMTQAYIAEKSGISQPYVSRALNGKLTRETKRTRRLAQVVDHIYSTMRRGTRHTPPEIGAAVQGYLALGGDPDLLIRQVDVLRRALAPPRRAEKPSIDGIALKVGKRD